MATGYSGSNSRRRAYVRRANEVRTTEDVCSPSRAAEWNSFSKDDRKKIIESLAFVGFAAVSGLMISGYEHDNPDPPFPDIEAKVEGNRYFFELGELTDQGGAQAVRASESTGLAGGAVSRAAPIAKMLHEKCSMGYRTDGAPLDLLLHYSRQYPSAAVLSDYLNKHVSDIQSLITRSSFSRIWIYSDWPPKRVLWSLAR